MLDSYLPALFFLILGLAVGGAFAVLNLIIGPKRPGRSKDGPVRVRAPLRRAERVPVRDLVDLIAMLFILFDIQVIFLIWWRCSCGRSAPSP